MTAISERSNPQTSKDLYNTTFSAALQAGRTHCDWLAGLKINPSLREAALVSHSVSPEKAQELKTSDTFGPLFDGSLPSIDLALSLGNRLVAELDVNGSMEYRLTWKQSITKLGRLIYRLAASGRRISGNGCGGWPTPRVNDSTGPQECPNRTGGASLKQVAGWGTPRVAKNNGYGSIKRSCDGQARIEDQVTGIIINGLNVEMVNKEEYRLNPLFSLWLMGYPEEWLPLEE